MKIRKKSGNILHISHCWGGGIPVYLADIKHIIEDDFNVFVLKCTNGKIELEYGTGEKIRAYYNLPRPLSLTEISDPNYRKIVSLVMKAFEIDIVHINITLEHTFDIFQITQKMGIPLIYTVHDYFYICPTFHLIDRNGVYCKICKYGKENGECLKNHPYINNPEFDKRMLKRWRSEFFKVKDLIDIFIFPSFSSKDLFTSFYKIKNEKNRVIYHGTSLERSCFLSNKIKNDLRVGILGSMFKHKGESLFKYILANIQDEKIKFYHFGEGFLKSKNLFNFGAYERSKILNILRDNQIDVIILLSTWPETFSYTLTESISAGIPPIVTNLGSLKERVEKDKIGWVVEYDNPENICELLRYIRANQSEIETRREQIKKYKLKTITEMKEEYLNIYNSIMIKKPRNKFDAFTIRDAMHELNKLKVKAQMEMDREKHGMGPLSIFMTSMNKRTE